MKQACFAETAEKSLLVILLNSNLALYGLNFLKFSPLLMSFR